MIRIGIDPGVHGAIAVLEGEDVLHGVYDMPTMNLTGKKQQVNAAEVAKLIEFWLPIGVALLERVAAMPGQGVSGMFNFGVSYGVMQGVLGTLKIPMVLVSPLVWKRRAGLAGKEKEASRTLAQQLYPAAPLSRVKDIGRADAILIARFGSQKED